MMSIKYMYFVHKFIILLINLIDVYIDIPLFVDWTFERMDGQAEAHRKRRALRVQP